MFFSDKDHRRFHAKYTKREPDQCWLWTAAHTQFGYGCFYHRGRQELAHRIAYELWNGRLPEGAHVMHSCDTPACINPGHLVAGTAKENLQDAARKGRTTLGERNSHAKLTRNQVEEIRLLYAAKLVSAVELGRRYGVTDTHIYSIVTGKTWRLEGQPVTRRRPGVAKLMPEDVLEIRRLWDAGEATQPQLSKQYGVKRCQINRIVHRKVWLSV